MVIFLIVLTLIIIPLALGLIENAIYTPTKKELAENASLEKTHAPIVGGIILLILAVIFTFGAILGGICLYIFSNLTAVQWLAYALGGAFIISLSTLAYLSYTKENESITQEGIYIRRLFRKTRLVRYAEIKYYTLNEYGQLTVFGADGKCNFFVGSERVGILSLVTALETHGVPKK